MLKTAWNVTIQMSENSEIIISALKPLASGQLHRSSTDQVSSDNFQNP